MNSYIKQHFKPHMEPLANAEAMVIVGNARFTMLTPRLVRVEYDPVSRFEDRASLSFWNRKLDVPEFKVRRIGEGCEIETAYLSIKYLGGEFNKSSLRIKVKHSDSEYGFGDYDSSNLKGTARTLDGVDGACSLEQGLVSRKGWSVIYDNLTVVINDDFWVESRYPAGDKHANSTEDFYFFGYGEDYRSCIKDYVKITGKTPMFPRFVLGNWWSRYHAYTQEELEGLMDDFQKHKIPLSVCIIDMDWHVLDNPYHSGWTGYTWNKELFPDPQGHIKFLHDKGLKTALNLHPADGVAAHEEYYPEMAKHMGIDPESKERVFFDITDPRFADGYFRYLHHPHEEKGVDFWWMDWQQGQSSKIPGLDPLRWINHLHFYDSGRDGEKRPFIFSRYGGYGSHRYPIGFSGDTFVSWESLEFQSYFTQTASNVAYGWWSHDIGGHMGGCEDPELYLRWIQLGVFSPVLRIHSTNNRFLDRRPWAFDAEFLKNSSEAFRLRHSLIPYLYTMLYRNYEKDLPLIEPMYYEYPNEEAAYNLPSQYVFGTELMVAPFVKPMDKDVMMSRTYVWFPKGDWFDFFTGEKLDGGRTLPVYGDLKTIPVYAKAGAIVPMGPKVGWGGVDNPETLEISIFPNADNVFELYEDDGETVKYTENDYAITTMKQTYTDNKRVFEVAAVKGNTAYVPQNRDLVLRFRHSANAPVEVSVNGKTVAFDVSYCNETETLVISGISLTPTDSLVVTLPAEEFKGRDRKYEKVDKLLRTMRLDVYIKEELDKALENDKHLLQDPKSLLRILDKATSEQVRAFMETITEKNILELM